ncbi:DMT family transporter [Trebonia sp.]|uniref:DMT family transporter n=1 Tax=Trebonia sp. TaxID=2767075 RepID=UPI0026077E02|nr:DMT family transporter [Trebonia sp.]
MTIVYALLAALGNALNVVTQHVASIASPKKATGWRLVGYLFRSPLWLFGWIALAAAFLFQALALHAGQMSVVQPLLVTELVFALVLRRTWIRQPIRPATWWAAAVTCASLGVFLATAEPRGGNPVPASHAWITAGVATVGAAVALMLLGLRGPPARRAALLAIASGIMWALVATFIKTTTETLSQFGAGGMFTHWPVYALAFSGAAAETLQQATLHVGPLSVSQPLLVIVDPVVSIALSVWIFGEYFTTNPLLLTVSSAAFAAMCVAVSVLTRTAPATMSAPARAPAQAPSQAG